MEQQAQAQGIPIDPLLPPNDPTRPRINRRAVSQQKIDWDASPAASPLFPGFSSDPAPLAPTPSWEPQGFSVDSFNPSSSSSTGSYNDSSSSSSSEDSGASKSSWKFW
jgi:hypothetical protein